MADLGLQSQGSQEPPASNPEDQLLFQTQLRTASVQFSRNAAEGREVCGIVGIEQIQSGPAHLYLPDSDPQLEARQIDGQAQPFAVWLAHRSNRKLAGIIEWVQGLLVTLCINFLSKIALLVEQADSGHRDAQVTCGFKLIAGNVAEPAGINGQPFAQHELH